MIGYKRIKKQPQLCEYQKRLMEEANEYHDAIHEALDEMYEEEGEIVKTN